VRGKGLGARQHFYKRRTHEASDSLPAPSTTVFSGALPHESDIITVSWASDYNLELSLSNQVDIQELMASYEGIDVSVRFVPPDPRERAKWVDFQRLQTEEMGDTDGHPSTGK
jgi:hypothetical protein